MRIPSIPRTIQVPIYLQLKPTKHGVRPGVISAALAGIPKPAADLYLKGVDAAVAGDTKRAIDFLSNAVSYYPEFALALNELGVQYLKVGLPDKAATALGSALKIKPDEFVPRLNYGIALLNQKRYAAAEENLRVAVAKNPAPPTAHMYLGISLAMQRKIDEAEKELLIAIKSASHEVSLAHRYLGGVYIERREYKLAAEELEKYLTQAPKAPDAQRIRSTIQELRSKKA
jgi:Flp pilus assembly protein TadD